MNINDFRLVLIDTIGETVSIENKKGHDITLRIVQDHNDKEKVHGTNIKVHTYSNRKQVQLYIDPNTMLIDRDRSMRDAKSDKDLLKIYKDNVDIIGGAILYAKDELQDYFKKGKERGDRSEDEVQAKMNEFSKLLNKNDPKFKKYCKYAKEGKIDVKESFFDDIEFI